jgi:predicted transcriptional regulator
LLEAKQKRRDQLSIIANILEISRGGLLKTQIMYRANLSYTQLNEYLSLLLARGLMARTISKGKDTYVVTVEGEGFLGGYRELTKTLRGKPTKSNRIANPFSTFQAPRAVH